MMNTFDDDVDDKEEPQVLGSMDEEGSIVNIPYLNRDIVAKIITKVPTAESIFVNYRCVCKLWFNIITNDIPFLMHPINSEPPGLIIQTMDNFSQTYLSSLSEEGVPSKVFAEPRTFTTHFFKLGKEENEVEHVDDLSSCFKYRRILDCFNGLILAISDDGKHRYIVNPVTKQQLELPHCFSEYYTKIIFVPSTGEYKVLQVIRREHCAGYYIRIARLFSGNDGCVDYENLHWKLIDVPKYLRVDEVSDKWLDFYTTRPLAVNGILYFTPYNEFKYPQDYIVCFDARDVIFYKIAQPKSVPLFGWFRDNKRNWYIDIGGSLGYIQSCTPLRQDKDQLDIYILNDDRKGREWIKQYSISLTPSFLMHHEELHPLCSLRDGEVIIFSDSSPEGRRHCQAYDVKLNRWWLPATNVETGKHSFALATNMGTRGYMFAGLHVQRTTSTILQK